MTSWITENIQAYMIDCINSIIAFMGSTLNNIFYDVIDHLNNSGAVQSAEKYIVAFSLALVPLAIGKIVLSSYVLDTGGDSDADPFDLVVRLCETVAAITSEVWVFDFLLQMSKDFANDLSGSTQLSGVSDTSTSLINNVVGAGQIASSLTLMIGIIIIAFIVFSIVAGVRGGEIIALKLAFPFFALDLLTSSHERWNNFIMAYVIAFFTYAFQIMFFLLAVATYASASVGNSQNFIYTLVFLYLAMFGPKSIEKYLYKSGVTQSVGGGVRMLVSTVALKVL